MSLTNVMPSGRSGELFKVAMRLSGITVIKTDYSYIEPRNQGFKLFSNEQLVGEKHVGYTCHEFTTEQSLSLG